jgi:PKD repeat protein
VPLAVNFSDASSGTPTSWSWTFGDGGTSSAQNPSHTYTASGTYTVTLTAANAYGSDPETKTGYITVNDPAGGDYATLPYTTGFESGSLDGFWTTATTNQGRMQVSSGYTPHSGSYQLLMDDSVSGGNYSQCEAWLHLDLAGESQVDLDFWWKEFGDETHAQDGVYFSNNGGSSFVKVFNLNGASYANQAWQNFTLDVDQLAAGAGLSLTSTFVVKFQQYDNYPMTSDGFAFDDISVTGGPQGTAPTAAFSGTPTSGTYPLVVSFADASTDAPTSWSWTFGDGGTSTAQNPSHTYTAAGTYSVTLTASNAFGADAFTRTNYITVTAPAGGVWETITYDGFESGLGSYTDGGGDCARYTGGTYAYAGSAAMDIQDNSGVASSFYHTAGWNVSGYVEMEVEFYFYAVSMDNSSEDFWVQYFDGSVWRTVATFARSIDFDNNVFYNATVTIPNTYVYPTNAKLRFLCDASGNVDDVYIDEITWRGLTAGGAGGGLAEQGDAPELFGLTGNYPNPFNPMTTVAFSLEAEGPARLEIFDLAGRRVAVLVDGVLGSGRHEVPWKADEQASGLYVARLTSGGKTATLRMTLVR